MAQHKVQQGCRTLGGWSLMNGAHQTLASCGAVAQKAARQDISCQPQQPVVHHTVARACRCAGHSEGSPAVAASHGAWGFTRSSEQLLRPVRHLSQTSHRVVCSAQVCKRWQGILKNPGHGSELWREVIIDFGHELITAVHTPIAWSDRRPSDEEFRCLALHLASYGTSCVQRYVYHTHTHPRVSVCSSLPAM